MYASKFEVFPQSILSYFIKMILNFVGVNLLEFGEKKKI